MEEEEEEGDIPRGPAGISANSSIQMMSEATGGHGGLRGTIMSSGGVRLCTRNSCGVLVSILISAGPSGNWILTETYMDQQ